MSLPVGRSRAERGHTWKCGEIIAVCGERALTTVFYTTNQEKSQPTVGVNWGKDLLRVVTQHPSLKPEEPGKED